MSDAKRIKELLRERVAELAPYLFPNGTAKEIIGVSAASTANQENLQNLHCWPESRVVGRLRAIGKAFSKSARSVDGRAEL